MNDINSIVFLAAANTDKTPVIKESFIFGWFDGVMIILIIIGLLRGKKRGMSAEFLDLIQWLIIIAGGGALNQPLGTMLAQASGMKLNIAALLVYVGFAILMKTIFIMFKGGIGKKLAGSELFGGMEYYLGMFAGMVRYACMGLAVVAMVNAWDITDVQVNDALASQKKELGKVYFPPPVAIQYSLCKESFVGTFVKHHLPTLLVTSSPLTSTPKQENIGQKLQNDLDDIVGSKSGTNKAKSK